MSGPPAVELRGLVKRFADHAAVDDVSLTIAPGEFFSLLGASGCGKTTTLRMIAGFEPPSAGQVLLAGEDITARPAHLRPVGMVFQHYALFPHLSVFENIAFALRLRRTAQAEVGRRVEEALTMVRLPGLAHRKPGQLSGGQQQRVALARALVSRPAVVLLDEPLGALDLKLRKAMQLELKTLQREVGLTFVYVTHDQEEALTMSDRIAVMDKGKVVQLADPRTIYERPASRFVADFIGVSNFLLGRILERKSGSETLIELANNNTVRAVAEAEANLSVGQQVTVVIRPERMMLLPPPESHSMLSPVTSWNTVPGSVRNVVYTGSDTQYFVDLGACGVVMVRASNDVRGRVEDLWEPTPGERVRVGWDAASGAVLKE